MSWSLTFSLWCSLPGRPLVVKNEKEYHKLSKNLTFWSHGWDSTKNTTKNTTKSGYKYLNSIAVYNSSAKKWTEIRLWIYLMWNEIPMRLFWLFFVVLKQQLVLCFICPFIIPFDLIDVFIFRAMSGYGCGSSRWNQTLWMSVRRWMKPEHCAGNTTSYSSN